MSNRISPVGGAPEARQIHYPYGEVRWAEGSPHADYGYTGQRYDAGSALLFLHARYYDPALGRFISADTIVPKPGNPQDFNRYAYAANNPLRFIDPSGHFPLAAIALAAGVALIADYGLQVHHNTQRGLPFWDAVYHENINEVEMVGAGVAGGTGAALTAFALPAVPAAVSATGLSGTSAFAATIATSAAVGSGASVAGEFAGRVWENSVYNSLGESNRTDLWSASTYGDDLVWGFAAGAASGVRSVVAQSAISTAQARAISELRTQAASNLWDLTLQQGGQWPPGNWSGSARNEGLRLYLQWQCGPTAAQVEQATAEYAVMIQTVGDAFEIVVQDDVYETLFPIWRDNIPE